MERKNEAKWVESRQRWQLNIQHDGERKTFTSSTPGKKGKIETEKKADKWIESKLKKDVRFGVLWAEFLEDRKESTSTGNYRNLEQIGRIWLLPELQHKRISTITTQDFKNIIKKAHKAGRYKKTLENIAGAITSVCRYAAEDRRPLERPLRIPIPDNAPVKERVILQPGSLATLFKIDTIIKNKKPSMCFFIHAWRFEVLTGMRPGEVAGLKKTDIADTMLTIRRSINWLNEETKGKNKNARRVMKLTKRAVSVLQDQADMLKGYGIISPWVFPNEDGDVMEPRHCYKLWQTYREQHGITSSLYELRHTMISLSKSDMPKPLLKMLVGHSESMDTYGVYGHEVDGDLKRAADILDDIFDKLL